MSNDNVNDGNKAVDLSDYVAAMKKTSFTQNWDIAVTFDHKKITDLSAERFRKDNHGLLTDLEVSIEMKDRLGETYTQWYQFILGSPFIQFESTPYAPSCSLKVGITKGRVWADFGNGKTENEEELEPNVYTISICNIGLGAITGNAQEWNDANTLKASGGNDLVVFPDEDGYASQIIIDLAESSQLSVKVECDCDVKVPYALKQDQLSIALRDFFVREIKPIHYTLAVINNVRPSEDTTDLVPKSFRFTTLRASNVESYLTIFMQTQSSNGRNNDQSLQSLQIAEWTKAGVPPIPKDSSASIIINDSFFATSFISPTLARYNATSTLGKTSEEEGGIRLKGTWPNVTRPDVPWETHVRLIALEETKRFRVHSVTYDPNVGGSPLQITLAQSNGTDQPATVSIEWSYSFDNPWNGSISRTERGPPVVGVPVRNVLELNGTFTSTYSVLLKNKDLIALDDTSFHVQVKKSDWKVDTSKAKSTDIRDILLPVPVELVDQKKLQEFAKDAAIDTIDFSFDLAKLKMFAQTNVLLMGKATEINIQSGVRVPRDVVVVGDVITV